MRWSGFQLLWRLNVSAALMVSSSARALQTLYCRTVVFDFIFADLEHKKAVVAAGALPRLFELLGSSDADMRRTSAAAFGFLCDGDGELCDACADNAHLVVALAGECKRFVVAAGALPRLVELMRDASCAGAAAAAVGRMCKGDGEWARWRVVHYAELCVCTVDCKKAVIATGALMWIVQLLPDAVAAVAIGDLCDGDSECLGGNDEAKAATCLRRRV